MPNFRNFEFYLGSMHIITLDQFSYARNNTETSNLDVFDPVARLNLEIY